MVTAAVCAVVAGYRSYTAIAEWVADVPDATVLALGIAPDRRPSEAMIRRLLQALDPRLLTAAIGLWLAGRATTSAATGRRAIAVDGKSLRGSRTTDAAARHVMAACDQVSSVVLADTDVDGKTNEITRFQPRDSDMPVDVRVAGALLLLYGLPMTKIIKLRADQLTEESGRRYLTVKAHRAIIPPAVGHLLDFLPTRLPADALVSTQTSR
ncbi:transposase family protein [Micromonospora sp. DH14]|uniref:transposase family protein n=1 Tax=Micromonospora sp. DH14 TaxID=3040120 RepID=UPI00244240D5|nr:transposase family protein [Micromonospora sp. DH14]MDG9674666.1 transposase family protein [Micromonospora sp. DH14]